MFDEKTAMQKFDQWNGEHESKVLKRREHHKAEKRARIHGPVVKKAEEDAAPKPVEKAEKAAPETAPETAPEANKQDTEKSGE